MTPNPKFVLGNYYETVVVSHVVMEAVLVSVRVVVVVVIATYHVSVAVVVKVVVVTV
jgi:hypothetical protein